MVSDKCLSEYQAEVPNYGSIIIWMGEPCDEYLEKTVSSVQLHQSPSSLILRYILRLSGIK